MNAEALPRRFEGQVALVTGAASGIGATTALRLAREGARVHLVDVQAGALEGTAEVVKREGLPATFSVADVSDAGARRRAVEEGLVVHGALHVLVNNAGIFLGGSFAELPLDHYRRTMDVNLKGAFFVAQEATRAISSAGGGAIVNVSSVYGLVGESWRDSDDVADYSASKAGLATLTRQLAVELAPLKIRVNAVCPGPISTPMNVDWEQDRESWEGYTRSKVSLRRHGTADEVAAAIAFLASDEASYVTGALVPVDGGLTAL